MKRILVPTDFSEIANSAINFAIESSKLFETKISLLHSYEVNSDFSYDYMGYDKEFNISMLGDIEKELDKISAEIEKKHNIVVNTSISTYPLNNALRKTAKERESDLIVMGTLGASGIQEKLWGSRTSSVIGHTDIPVMVIPHHYAWKKPSKILFATNEFIKDEEILNTIFELAGLYMANVEVGVYTDIIEDNTDKYLKNQAEIEEYGHYLRDRYNEKTLSSFNFVGSDFKQTIQEHIEENEIDLLVMVTHQKGFWQRLFNPSMTEAMSFNTKIPLLAIPLG